MLVELHVSDLGVIDDLTVLLGPGTTALTGETGAGKTLIVDAIELLLGGPGDADLVRPGATEAVIEGRFVGDDDMEVVLSRVVPRRGRSRAYVDGRMSAAAQLAELGGALVDLHGQHTHQSLLAPAAQRAALDAFAGISTADVTSARQHRRDIETALASLGGDARTRARELDLLGYQLEELDRADLVDPDEDEALQSEEERLAGAAELRDAAGQVWAGVAGEDGVVDRLGDLVGVLGGKGPLAALHERLRALETELADAATEARTLAETLEDDPERLAAIGSRRHLLGELRRKYGATLADVIAFREESRARVAELEAHDARAAALEGQRTQAEAELAQAELELWGARRAAAPDLAAAVESELRTLAMPRARFAVEVAAGPPGDDVTWMLGANPGEAVLPLAKVASGGELARTMLAVRLVCRPAEQRRRSSAGPMTLVFDEVDAGVGGEAAAAVGRALASLGTEHQVLVVTHLPQVAAFADRHLVVRKDVVGERTVATVHEAAGQDRIVELSRMLSGSPDSETARLHAGELLARARRSPIPQ
jgi:DNA repair protein RecN (Recombination protein N)